MLNLIASNLKEPGGLWVKLINGIQSSIGNFGWTIILFTLIIKLVLSVLDFFIKWSTRRSTLIQQRCAPQIEKVKRKFPNNQQMVQTQTMAIYKKEGYNVFSSCIIMLVNLVVTILVFFSIFTSLKEVSAYQAIKQYEELNTTITSSSVYTSYYESNLNAKLSELEFYEGEGKEYSQDELTQINAKKAELASASLDTAIADESVRQTVLSKWNENKDSWLWITNIWVTDGKADPLPTYKSLQSLASGASGMFNSGVKDNYIQKVSSINETEYNKVTSIVQSTQNGWNGYYILAVLAAGLTFLSTYVAELGNKIKREKKENKPVKNQFIQPRNPQTNNNQTPNISSSGTMKFMKILLPALMVVFVLTSSSAFGIYVVSQSAISILLSYLINLIVKALTKKQETATIEFLDKYENKK
ncbi:MAG: YidC/Oxa1 family membrane protein insertase [Clostridia bacterium]|nr:YidC/Oxa1 family membrane protein insertase [Clostridia bacterium]